MWKNSADCPDWSELLLGCVELSRSGWKLEVRLSSSKWEAKSLEKGLKEAVLTVQDQKNAFVDLFLAAQENVIFPDTTLSRLAVYKDENSGPLVCGGRIQSFNEDKTAVPYRYFTRTASAKTLWEKKSFFS